MKRLRSVAVAGWLVEHLTFGLPNEGLCGDLLEEFQLGRSAAWFWRQAGYAIAIGLFCRLRDLALPLTFCAAWTSLYPGWNAMSQAMAARALPDGWTALPWPWSALLPLMEGLFPAIAFVWTGFLIYLAGRPGRMQEIAAQRLLRGLSASLNVLLVSTLLLLRHFRHTRVDLLALTRADFFSAFHFLWISIPLALSLLAALFATVSGNPRVARKQRLPGLPVAGRFRRFVGSGQIG